MLDIEEIFHRRRMIKEKLISYGFAVVNDGYEYRCQLIDNCFEAIIHFSSDGKLTENVIDLMTNERYVPLYQPQAVGSYVGKVREVYHDLLQDIASHCFEEVLFSSEMARKVIRYIDEQYHHPIEFLWESLPENGVVRHPENKKWYAVILHVSKRRMGLDEDGSMDVLNLKNDPKVMSELVDNKHYYPAYHMNKKYWMSIPLDESVPFDEICYWIQVSYQLTNGK